jgi:hypothetical protein
MWEKVCPKACPQKTNMVDHYLDGFYLCGMTLVSVAERCAVSPKAVENALKRFDREVYLRERTRRKEENRHKRREKDRERKHREREGGSSYVLAVKKAMRNPIVNQAIRIAIRQHLAQGKDEHTAWAATLVAPYSIPHPEPHVIAGMPDEMTHKMAGRASEYESRADRAGLAGVPGHEILELYRLVESGQDDLALINLLATLAVKRAGYINADATLEQLEQSTAKIIEPEEWHEQWIAMKENAVAWAPKEDPLPKDGIPQNWKRPAFRPGYCFSANGGTGKKGKRGGKQDESNSVAFSAVSRI